MSNKFLRMLEHMSQNVKNFKEREISQREMRCHYDQYMYVKNLIFAEWIFWVLFHISLLYIHSHGDGLCIEVG